MHIEPGIVNGAKIALSYATGLAAVAYTGKLIWSGLRTDGPIKMAARTVLATIAVFCFFQVLPHYPVGVSEVHFILGSTLFLMFGAAPAAIGLAAGLLLQGLLFAPFDLPQYGINITTLLVPLFGVQMLAKKIIVPNTAYVDLSYGQAFALSTAYQAGIVSWVGFWAFYGQGFGAETVASVTSFGAAYMLVVLIEPIADLAVLAGAKSLRSLEQTGLLSARVYNPA